MKALRRLVNGLRCGATRPLALAYLLGVTFAVGYLGLLNHKYEHFGDPQPELTCHLCIAGDQYTPVAEPPVPFLTPTAGAALPGDNYETPPLRSPRAAHKVRAPPPTA
jgi:hypothetical protein